MAYYRLPIHPASCLHLVLLYEYTGGGLHVFPVDGVGLWWLNFDQRTFSLGVLDEAASGNRNDSRVDDRGSHRMLPLSILPLHYQLLAGVVRRNWRRISSHHYWNVLATGVTRILFC